MVSSRVVQISYSGVARNTRARLPSCHYASNWRNSAQDLPRKSPHRALASALLHVVSAASDRKVLPLSKEKQHVSVFVAQYLQVAFRSRRRGRRRDCITHGDEHSLGRNRCRRARCPADPAGGSGSAPARAAPCLASWLLGLGRPSSRLGRWSLRARTPWLRLPSGVLATGPTWPLAFS
jgi:hypothetical protein